MTGPNASARYRRFLLAGAAALAAGSAAVPAAAQYYYAPAPYYGYPPPYYRPYSGYAPYAGAYPAPPAYYPQPPGVYPPPPASAAAVEATPLATPVPTAGASSAASGFAYTSKPAFTNAAGQPCREYQATDLRGGQPVAVYGTACRQDDGQWRVVN